MQLVREKPWMNEMHSVFNGTLPIPDVVDEITDDQRILIIEEFNRYFRDPTLTTYKTDMPLQREINKMMKEG